MGYGSRLYIVNKTSFAIEIREKLMFYCEKIATFNLSKVPDVSNKLLCYKDTDGYFYAEDYDDVIIEDEYGKPLKEIPVSDVIEILEDASSNSNYRRFIPCLQLLKGFNLSEWENLVVLYYGY